MKKSQIAQFLDVSEDKVSKALNAIGIDHNQSEYDRELVFDVEAVIKMVAAEGITYKIAGEKYLKSRNSIVTDDFVQLSPELVEQLEAAIAQSIPEIEGDMTETLRRRRKAFQNLITQMVDRNLANQIKALDPKKIRAELTSEPLTIEVLEGKPVMATLPSSEGG